MSQEFRISAPLSGSAHTLADVPDRAFADGMLGPGIAIYPTIEGKVTVHAPASGLIRTIHPHAFVLQVSPKLAVLVHLGVDTYRADEQQFTPQVEQGRYVNCCDPVIEWNVAETVEADFLPWVVVTLLGFKRDDMDLVIAVEPGDMVSQGSDLLFLTTGLEDSAD